MRPEGRFNLLYDSACPICRREVAWLRRRDRKGRLHTTDIRGPGFDPRQLGLTRDAVHGELHGVTADGTVVRGMQAVRAAYAAAGVGWIMAPTAWPGMRRLFDRLYRLFARHRVRLGRWLGGRGCDGDACAR